MTESNLPPTEESAAPPPPVSYATPTSTGYPGPYVGPPPDPEVKRMGMLGHLLAILTAWVGPLILWLVKKDGERVGEHAHRLRLRVGRRADVGTGVTGGRRRW